MITAAPHIWTPPKWLGARGLADLMAHLKKGPGGHLVKTSSGHLSKCVTPVIYELTPCACWPDTETLYTTTDLSSYVGSRVEVNGTWYTVSTSSETDPPLVEVEVEDSQANCPSPGDCFLSSPRTGCEFCICTPEYYVVTITGSTPVTCEPWPRFNQPTVWATVEADINGTFLLGPPACGFTLVWQYTTPAMFISRVYDSDDCSNLLYEDFDSTITYNLEMGRFTFDRGNFILRVFANSSGSHGASYRRETVETDLPCSVGTTSLPTEPAPSGRGWTGGTVTIKACP